MDQTDLGDRFAILMVSVRVGERALPLAWAVEAGAANLGFAAQRTLLEIVLGWLRAGAAVLLAAGRFYPSAPLFAWLQAHGWGYRLRLIGGKLPRISAGTSTPSSSAAMRCGSIDVSRGSVSADPTTARILIDPPSV